MTIRGSWPAIAVDRDLGAFLTCVDRGELAASVVFRPHADLALLRGGLTEWFW
jgi:hypothetical protein